MEATETPEIVLKYYDGLLEVDSANAVRQLISLRRANLLIHLSSLISPPQAIWKRRISVLRRTGKTEQAVDELSEFLDTFYNDVEGWLELVDIYTSCNQ